MSGERQGSLCIRLQSVSIAFDRELIEAKLALDLIASADISSRRLQKLRLSVIGLCAYLVATVENGCFAGTNSTGTPFTNPFNQRVHSSIPACSLGMCPITINAFLLLSVTASSTYSTVSHSTVSPTRSTSTSSISSVCVSDANPSNPGLNAIFVTFISGLPTYRTTGDPNVVATCSAKFFTVVSRMTKKCSLSDL